jgi:hypothetical protein
MMVGQKPCVSHQLTTGVPMGAIDAILSSPIPTIVLLVVCVLLGAGYWFFVFPLLDEIKTLRTRDADWQGKYDALNDKFTESNVKNTETLKSFSATMDTLRAATEKSAGNDAIQEDFRTFSESIMQSLGDIRLNLGKDTSRQHAELHSQVDNIERTTERILKSVADVSDKQSQVSGIILGITMRGGGSPPRGL